MHTVISGSGQFHTNEFDPTKPNRKLKPYLKIGLNEIRMLVDKPMSTKKSMAKWIIPSDYPSRNYKEQAKSGRYLFLWADLDKEPRHLIYIKGVLDIIVGGDFEIYTTSSATTDNPKSRILIPLANPLSPSDWLSCQQNLNKLLSQHGITPDKANERYGQLCYLPNRGQYYDSTYRRENVFFNPMIKWDNYDPLNLSTECTEGYRGVQKSTDVIVTGGGVVRPHIPPDCCPKEEGQRNKCLFTFGRYLKQLHPEADFEFLRPIVLEWHNHFIEVIGTKSFSETWTDFRRGWAAIKVPYGQGIESIVNSIDFGIPIPQTFMDMGYGAKEFKLLLICHQLQLIHGEEPFFLSARKAEEFINYHFTGTAKMLNSLVADGFLILISKGDKVKASRYKYIWKNFIEKRDYASEKTL